MRSTILSLVAVWCLLASAARAQNPVLELVTGDPDAPSYLADPGDGRLFITQLDGVIRIFANGQLQTTEDAFLDIRGPVDDSGEGGLHSMAFDPGYATNRHFYVAYTRTGSGGSPLETVIARYTTPEGDPSHADPNSAHIVLTQLSPVGVDFSNHKGGQLQFGGDGFLYFAFGDGGSSNDPQCLAQKRDTLLGKMLRIDPSGDDFGGDPNRNYAIPAGNPFASDPNYAPEIWALGLRNPYRFSFDSLTDDLWIGDVGQGTREEVDMSPAPNAGRQLNYGWKVREGSVCRHQNAPGGCEAYVAGCDDAGYTDPVHDYPRDVGRTVIGGYVYRGSAAAWRGRYIFADYIVGELFALVEDGSDWNRISIGSVGSPISFGEDHEGELYVLSISGNVYKLAFDAVTQSKQQQACVRKLNEDFGKLANAVSSHVRSCIDQGAKGKLDVSVDACVAGDPKGKLAKAAGKAAEHDEKLCVEPLPEVGYAGAGAGNEAATDAELELTADVFGADLQAAVTLRAEDKSGAACQLAVYKAVAACQKARRAEFLRCKKAGLKDGLFETSTELAACLELDPKARIQKSCGKVRAKAIQKSCVDKSVGLADAFPGCNESDPDSLASCLDARGRCRTCELYDAADALDADCSAACEP